MTPQGTYYVTEKEPLAGFLPKKILVFYHVDKNGLLWVRTVKGEWKLKITG
jgi:ligand-binding sensor domain-containing protein